MINIPGQTREEIINDLEFIRRIDPTYVSISVYNWAPDTALYSEALANGTLTLDYWRQYAQNPIGDEPVHHYVTETTIDEVYALRDLFLRRYYFRPSYILPYLVRMSANEWIRALQIAFMMIRSSWKAKKRGTC